ncbi:MAG: substrate-binding domain-containing protein, partial [Anaerolineales bacterium]|nr:substrate-binding domain-containing protein [Anaerolineales bacterium]
RRDFLKIAGLTGGASVLAACGTKAEPPQDEQAEEAPAQPEEKIALSFWTPGGSDQYCAGFTTIAENYMKANPNIVMNETQCNPTGENYTEVLLANIAAGNPPDATIVWASPVSYAVRGALEPLDVAMAASKNSEIGNWPEGVLASCQYDGVTYGLPAAAAPYAMYYNMEMFEAAGISTAREDFPKTWDEMRRLSKEFTKWDGDLLQTAGFIPFGAPADLYGMAVEFVIWAHTNGGGVLDAKEMKYMINSEQNIEMMHYALEWWEEEFQGDLIKVNTSANWGAYADSEGRPPAWTEGTYAMHNNGYWIATDMYANEMKMERWNVASYPVGPSGSKTASGYWPNWLVIPKGAQHVQESFDYLDYMVVDGMKVWFSIVPDLPANKKFPVDFVPQNLIDKVGETTAADVHTFFVNQLGDAVPMWNSPVEDFYLDKLSLALEQILAKAETPEDALGEVQRACQDELDKVLMG